MERYVLVSFPEIQDFMEHPRWSECVFCQDILVQILPMLCQKIYIAR